MATPLLEVRDKMLQAAPGNKGIIPYVFESNSCGHLLSSQFTKKLRMHCWAQRLSALVLLFISTQLSMDCVCSFFFFLFFFPCFVFKWKGHLFCIYMKSSFKSVGLPAALKSLQMLCGQNPISQTSLVWLHNLWKTNSVFTFKICHDLAQVSCYRICSFCFIEQDWESGKFLQPLVVGRECIL